MKMKWLKKFGLLGFLFFLAKGLIWLLIFAGAGRWFASFFQGS